MRQPWLVWDKSHQVLRNYLEYEVESDVARRLASKACGRWFRHIADGEDASQGSYVLLFAAAQMVLQDHFRGFIDTPTDELTRRIPTQTAVLPYHVTLVAHWVRRAVRLSNWDRQMINTASKQLGLCWPGRECTVVTMDSTVFTSATGHLSSCAFALQRAHEDDECEMCVETQSIWDEDDRRTEAWIVDQRLNREGLS